MLDRLLGRAGLKDRIADLEEDKRHLQRQLEAEEERRADAVSERQRAEERVNRLEDRIAELEGTVERLREGDGGEVEFRATESLSGERRDAVLSRLESVDAGPEGVLTAYVADGVPDAVREAFGDRAPLVERAAPCLAVADDAGILSATLSTPAPPSPFAEWGDAVALEREWFEPRGSFTLALVRSDLFAMGEYEGRERVAFHGFSGDLKSQHSKGGFSQARFERLRDQQIETHIERCRAALAERTTDRLYVVGERTVLDEFADVADVTATVDATGDPEPALGDAFHDFWTVRLRAV
ncbi:MAG: Vms1/Ankzf1 family peptidyl-tRNA hydrolase [Halorientalis sp.]